MRIYLDRTFAPHYEILFLVKKWRPIYGYFNRMFADIRRRVSLVILDK